MARSAKPITGRWVNQTLGVGELCLSTGITSYKHTPADRLLQMHAMSPAPDELVRLKGRRECPNSQAQAQAWAADSSTSVAH